MSNENPCVHGHKEYAWWLYDAQGIEVAKVCDKCENYWRSKYRTVIFDGYSQADVDEPIEPEDYSNHY